MIKMYAVRDRLIDYFMQPFFAPSDAQALAAVGATINDEASTHAITLHPEHFEIYRIAEFNESTGQIGGDREYLQDAASLVRGSIRERGEPGAGAVQGPIGGRREPAPIAPASARAEQRAPQSPTQGKDHARAPADPGSRGTP